MNTRDDLFLFITKTLKCNLLQLSDKLEVPQSFISAIKRGEKKFSPKMMNNLKIHLSNKDYEIVEEFVFLENIPIDLRNRINNLCHKSIMFPYFENPIDTVKNNHNEIELQLDSNYKYCSIKVTSDTMLGILDAGDIAIYRVQNIANIHDIVFATVENNSYIKRYFVDPLGSVILKSDNPIHQPDIAIQKHFNFTIHGVIVMIIKNYGYEIGHNILLIK